MRGYHDDSDALAKICFFHTFINLAKIRKFLKKLEYLRPEPRCRRMYTQLQKETPSLNKHTS